MSAKNKALAAKIARELFALGDEPRSPTRRIAFRGGPYAGRGLEDEREQGGMVEFSLAEWLARRLDAHRVTQLKKGMTTHG